MNKLTSTVVLLLAVILIPACSMSNSEKYTNRKVEYMLPVEHNKTVIDRVIGAMVREHPNETGLILLDDNLDAFAVRAITAREAERSLDLQYYMWHNDLTGNLLGYELLRAADRGVRVRLLLDDLNVHDKDIVLAALDQHPNIEIRLFNPSYNRQGVFLRSVEMVFRGLSLNRRMHNKTWIADGQVAIVGGRNIGNEYFDAAPRTNFFDVDVLLAGNAVIETENIFDVFWNSPAVVPLQALVKVKKSALSGLRLRVKNIDSDMLQETNIYLERLRQSSGIHALFHGKRSLYWTDNAHVYSDPPEKAYDQNEDRWLINVLYPAWMKSKKELRLISPYFVPGKIGVTDLSKLHAQGVRVGILTNSLAATDVIMVHGGYAPYRVPLLKDGIKLYELMPYNVVKKKLLGSSGASLHTKVFMVDDRVSFVGSFNLDPRSARLNTEMGILFDQPELTKELLALYDSKIESENSYTLFLDKNKLRWLDGSVEPPKVWTHEPETGIFKRAITRVIRWLPIESQL